MIDPTLLKKILVDQNYITAADVEAGAAFEAANKGSFSDYLYQEGVMNKSMMGMAVAEYYGLTYSDLEARSPSNEDLVRIPEEIARTYRAVFVKERAPVGKDKGEVVIATDNPKADGLEAAIQKIFPGKKITVTYTFGQNLDFMLSHYSKKLETRFSEIIKKEQRIAPEILDEIIKDALTYQASDIHFEPQGDKMYIRFRIDGVLQLAGVISKEFYERVLNRIKIQANLRTDEHFAPQDGAIRFVARETPIDLRVSIVPTLDGEKVVIRILAEYVRGLSFAELGYNEEHVEMFESASRKPFGMILVSGPTGSGKTTTLYGLLKRLNTPQVNVTTIEDPVEYRMAGANQLQVNPKTGLTFAKGLRAIVRQDPNIILVGEIRDGETAETAVNAALTGHLLLSTFHANDAATCIPRLLEMGVEPFLLASTLELLVAQRLVRRICETCRYSYTEKVANLKKLLPTAKDYFGMNDLTLYRGKGCAACSGTGYKGRTSIVEMIAVTPAIKDLTNTRPSAAQIWEAARATGTRSLFEDGIDKVKTGVTTLEEVLRVAQPN